MGDSAKEGVRLHALAAEAILRQHEPPSREDWAQVWPYVRDVRDTHAAMGGTLMVERSVTHPDMKGTADAYLAGYNRDVVWDYKSGRRPVAAEDNWQLTCYAWLLGLGRLDRARTTDLRIVQPNTYHAEGPVLSWQPTAAELQDRYKRIKQAMTEARDAPKLVATPNNCTHCAAVTSCPAARDATLGGADMAATDTGQLPPEAFRTELVTLRTASELIRVRLDALEAEADAKLRAGVRLPGCTLRPGRGGALKWSADESKISGTLAALGVEAAKTKLITPRQAIDAGVPETLVSKMAERQKPKLSIVIDETRKTFSE
jgi:hypothetical protein